MSVKNVCQGGATGAGAGLAGPGVGVGSPRSPQAALGSPPLASGPHTHRLLWGPFCTRLPASRPTPVSGSKGQVGPRCTALRCPLCRRPRCASPEASTRREPGASRPAPWPWCRQPSPKKPSSEGPPARLREPPPCVATAQGPGCRPALPAPP